MDYYLRLFSVLLPILIPVAFGGYIFKIKMISTSGKVKICLLTIVWIISLVISFFVYPLKFFFVLLGISITLELLVLYIKPLLTRNKP
jgi:hypothetical protein